MMQGRLAHPQPRYRFIALLFYLLSTLQFAGYYLLVCKPYLKLSDYLALHERNPFQQRVLPVFLLRPLVWDPAFRSIFRHLGGAFLPVERGACILLSFAALLAATWFTLKLYDAVSPSRSLWFLAQPALMYTVLWTFTLRTQSIFYYPYDMLSVAFFAAGVYAVYTRRYPLLLGVMFVGTLNRETTVMLIVLYVIDACVSPSKEQNLRLRDRFDLRAVPWLRVGLLFAVWVAIKVMLVRRFAANDNSEDFIRVMYNLRGMVPKQWPSLLNICGFTMPLLLLFRRKIQPHRFGCYMLLLPVWVTVMLFKGVLYEARIYGELCPFAAVASLVLVEQYVSRQSNMEDRTEVIDKQREPEPETLAGAA